MAKRKRRTVKSSVEKTNKMNCSLRERKKQKKLINRISIVVSIILGLITALFTYKLFQLNMLPIKYLIPIIIVFILIDGALVFALISKKIKLKIKLIAVIVVIIIFIFDLIAYGYMSKALSFINGLNSGGYKTENYLVLVSSDSDIKTLDDLKNKQVAYAKTVGNSHDAMEELKKKTDIITMNAADTGELISGLLSKRLTSIVISESLFEMYKEADDESDGKLEDQIRVIDTITLEIKEQEIVKEVDVTKDTFVLYISGIDTFGPISTVSRSDVNIVAAINPKTKQVLLISIPRDYYVKLHGIDTDLKDKLTHAGMYGIEMSVATIEDLLDIDINYYLKVNFTSVVDIVDALGGIEVDSKYEFTTYENYSFKKGLNKLNGYAALRFCRERKKFSGGDRARGQNQQAVISAIIKKAASPVIIYNYNQILKALDGKFQTNIGTKNISKLIQMQFNDMASWKIKSISLDGSDSYNYSYSFPQSDGNAKNYVMEPNLDTIKRAQELIKDLKGNLELDMTDENKVYQTYSYGNNVSSSVNSSKTNSSISNLNSSSKSSSLSSSLTSISSVLSSSISSISMQSDTLSSSSVMTLSSTSVSSNNSISSGSISSSSSLNSSASSISSVSSGA